MNFNLKLGKAAAVLFLALAMAGCGGGGTTTMPEPPDPAPIDVERMGISDALAAASAAVGMVTDTSDDAVVMAADAAVAAAMAAVNGATLISSGEAATSRAELATIQGNLTAAKSSRTMAMTLASERMAISDAIAAAMTAVGAVMDDSDAATVMAADDAIAAATAAIDAADSISNSEASMARVEVAALQTTLDAAKSSRQMAMDDAAEAERQRMEMEARRTEQLAAITMAIDAARTAVAAVNDASTQQEVDDAIAAVANARAKIAEAADVADSVKDGHTASVDTIAMSLSNAETSRNAAIAASQELANQRMAISNAIGAARTAVAGVNDDSTDEQVEAAAQAIADARVVVAGADDVPAEEKAANNGTLAEITTQLETAKTARMEAIAEREKEAEAEREAMADAGKALKSALGSTPRNNLRADSAATPALHSLTSAGLALGIPNADASASIASPRMKPGTSAGSLGDWSGTNYAHKNAGTGVSNTAIVYTNQAAPTVKPFATGASFGANQAAFDTAYSASTRTLDLGSNFAGGTAIKGDMFPTAGTTDYTPTSPATDNVLRGTYQGAPGNYRCTGATGCGATATTGGGVTLVGDWVFIHDSGAMTSRPDANYLYFGWWLQKDKDDEPTSASAFTGLVGTIAALATNPSTLTGSATYTGHAAGKFAISDPLTQSGDAGHFTADATLNATFGTGASNGISGTIDGFMANGEAVPWSLTLFRRSWDTTNSGETEAADDTTTTTVDESVTQTVWSIDGNSAAASGMWGATMYDEAPGTVAAGGDGSNVATSVTGTFESHYGSTHTMVGAYGATIEE